MKKIFAIFIMIFAFSGCTDSSSKNNKSTADDFIGTFTSYTNGGGDKLIVTKNGNKFQITADDDYDGGFSCTIDKQTNEISGADDIPVKCIYFDCKTLSDTDNILNKEFKMPYVRLCHHIYHYNNKNYDSIWYDSYFWGKENYAICSTDGDKQSCRIISTMFFRPKIGE